MIRSSPCARLVHCNQEHMVDLHYIQKHAPPCSIDHVWSLEELVGLDSR
jgi:hypothetical protein